MLKYINLRQVRAVEEKKAGSPKGKAFKITAALLAALLLYTAVSLYVSRYVISFSGYEYDSEKIDAPINIIVITDLHSSVFGEDNRELMDKIKARNPDIIAFVGDGMNYYEKNEDFLYKTLEQLEKIAPVFFSPGNHENVYVTRNKLDPKQLIEKVESAGAVYLDQNYADVEINGQQLRIGGLYDYVFNKNRVPKEQYEEKGSYQFLKEYTETTAFKLMLTHRPESYINSDQDARWAIDLALCGHEHGGQIRLPFLGGFYSSHLGYFSPYLQGYHMVNGIPIIISKGLGTYYSQRTPPRFNNPPELVEILLK